MVSCLPRFSDLQMGLLEEEVSQAMARTCPGNAVYLSWIGRRKNKFCWEDLIDGCETTMDNVNSERRL